MEKDKYKEDDIPGLDRNVSFSVPEGYFDELPNRIMASLPETFTRKTAWWAQPRLWRVAVPALVVVLLTIGYQSLNLAPEVNSEIALGEVSDQELVAFLEQELDASDVMLYDLAYLADEVSLEENLWESSFEDHPVEDYLDDISLDELEDWELEDLGFDL
ncbi:MAG: hypothetical protein AAFQ98_08530 [Bacteroidota bacterium]